MDETRIEIIPTPWNIASCTSCFAHIHETRNPLGRKVDRLYEVQIGNMVVTLCDNCIDKLTEKLQNRSQQGENKNDI